jgi:hypothetical protein
MLFIESSKNIKGELILKYIHFTPLNIHRYYIFGKKWEEEIRSKRKRELLMSTPTTLHSFKDA